MPLAGPVAQSSRAPGCQPEGHGSKAHPDRQVSSGMRKKEIRLAWDQETPGALPGCPTIFICLPAGVTAAQTALTRSVVGRNHGGQILSVRRPVGVPAAHRAHTAKDRVQFPDGLPFLFPLLSSIAERPADNRKTTARNRQERPSVPIPACLRSIDSDARVS